MLSPSFWATVKTDGRFKLWKDRYERPDDPDAEGYRRWRLADPAIEAIEWGLYVTVMYLTHMSVGIPYHANGNGTLQIGAIFPKKLGGATFCDCATWKSVLTMEHLRHVLTCCLEIIYTMRFRYIMFQT